eukprot:TRINITY_DN19748_c0_g1_i2.p1 TRINITY_DN19748_c0_g1~~TRINITY_DN19748_c0_g1_i2.p1  ORF type:complete len:202 (+),score=36.31 TRINITY_DN19748_c0_g1_i2:85-690(+)
MAVVRRRLFGKQSPEPAATTATAPSVLNSPRTPQSRSRRVTRPLLGADAELFSTPKRRRLTCKESPDVKDAATMMPCAARLGLEAPMSPRLCGVALEGDSDSEMAGRDEATGALRKPSRSSLVSSHESLLAALRPRRWTTRASKRTSLTAKSLVLEPPHGWLTSAAAAASGKPQAATVTTKAAAEVLPPQEVKTEAWHGAD